MRASSPSPEPGRGWPEPVEAIAAFLRAAGVDARLEELPRRARDAADALGADRDALVAAAGFHGDGAALVALLPAERTADAREVARAAGCRFARPAPLVPFPYERAQRVLIDQRPLAHGRVWLPLGTPRHLLSLEPHELARLLRARPADLLGEA